MLRDGFLNLSHNVGLLISNIVPFSYICAEIEKQWGGVLMMRRDGGWRIGREVKSGDWAIGCYLKSAGWV